jgi:hypothetical protein
LSFAIPSNVSEQPSSPLSSEWLPNLQPLQPSRENPSSSTPLSTCPLSKNSSESSGCCILSFVSDSFPSSATLRALPALRVKGGTEPSALLTTSAPRLRPPLRPLPSSPPQLAPLPPFLPRVVRVRPHLRDPRPHRASRWPVRVKLAWEEVEFAPLSKAAKLTDDEFERLPLTDWVASRFSGSLSPLCIVPGVLSH